MCYQFNATEIEKARRLMAFCNILRISLDHFPPVFPVNSLFIRELAAETGSLQTAPTATQSRLSRGMDLKAQRSPHLAGFLNSFGTRDAAFFLFWSFPLGFSLGGIFVVPNGGIRISRTIRQHERHVTRVVKTEAYHFSAQCFPRSMEAGAVPMR